MGIRTYYRLVKKDMQDEFFQMIGKWKLDETQSFDLDSINDREGQLFFTSLDKAYTEIEMLLNNEHEDLEDIKTKITEYGIYGCSDELHGTGVNYVHREIALQFYGFLLGTYLQEKSKFLVRYAELYEKINRPKTPIYKFISAYKKDENATWISDIKTIKEERKKYLPEMLKGKAISHNNSGRHKSAYELFKCDLEYHYEYFLELVNFYKKCFQTEDSWVIITAG